MAVIMMQGKSPTFWADLPKRVGTTVTAGTLLCERLCRTAMVRVHPELGSAGTASKPLKTTTISKWQPFRSLKGWASAKLPFLASQQGKASSLRLSCSILGAGGHANVVMGSLGQDSVPVAVKILAVADKSTRQELDAFRRLGVPHRNVVDVYSHVMSPHHSHVHLPMELCDESLLEYVERNGGLEEEQAKPIFRDVVSGLLFLRGKGIHHLDVKPDNILMKEGVAKLSDLGMALEAEEALDPSTQAKKPYGTSRYASPECITARMCSEMERSLSLRLSRGESVPLVERKAVRRRSESSQVVPFDAEKADVWALGITMFAEIVGVYPWMVASLDSHFYLQWSNSFSSADVSDAPTNLPVMWKRAMSGLSSTKKGTPLSEDFMRLMRGMLHPDPAARFTLADVRDSAFFIGETQ